MFGSTQRFIFYETKRKRPKEPVTFCKKPDKLYLTEGLRYAGHITNSFRFGESILTITQIKIHDVNPQVKFEYCPDVEIKPMEKYGRKWRYVEPIGAKLLYMLIDIPNSALEGGNAISQRKFLGGCFLDHKGAITKTNFSIEPVEGSYLKVALDQRTFSVVAANPPPGEVYELSLAYILPAWIQQSPSDRILFPGAMVIDFLDLSLIAPQGVILNHKLKGLKLCLISLKRQFPHHFSKYYCFSICGFSRDEYETESFEVSPHKGKNAIQIPKLLYKGKIPRVRPSLANDYSLTSYAIRATAVLENQEGISYNTSAYLPVNIAKFARQKGFVERSILPTFASKKREKKVYVSFIDQQPQSSYVPELVGANLTWRLREHEIQFTHHTTITFEAPGVWVGLTSLICTVPMEPSIENYELWRSLHGVDKRAKRYELGYTNSSVVENEAIVYKAFRHRNLMLDPSTLFAGPVMLLQSGPVLTEFPHRHMNADEWEPPKVEIGLDDLNLPPTSTNLHLLTLRSTFCPTENIQQNENELIVLPETEISAFINLAIAVSSETYSLWNWAPNEFVISELEISLGERIYITTMSHGLCPVYPSESTEYMILQKKSCDWHFTWKTFEENVEAAEAAFSVPKDLYDAKIPNVGPTFFTSFHMRVYFLKIQMTVTAENPAWKRSFEIYQRINIASPPTDSAYVEADPPRFPFEEQASRNAR